MCSKSTEPTGAAETSLRRARLTAGIRWMKMSWTPETAKGDQKPLPFRSCGRGFCEMKPGELGIGEPPPWHDTVLPDDRAGNEVGAMRLATASTSTNGSAFQA